MLQAGDRVRAASVWIVPHERHAIGDLLAEGRALFLFFLFDWSAT
jgi:hypothetical protein